MPSLFPVVWMLDFFIKVNVTWLLGYKYILSILHMLWCKEKIGLFVDCSLSYEKMPVWLSSKDKDLRWWRRIRSSHCWHSLSCRMNTHSFGSALGSLFGFPDRLLGEGFSTSGGIVFIACHDIFLCSYSAGVVCSCWWMWKENIRLSVGVG